MLSYSASIEINCYDLKDRRILIGIQKGWHAKEVQEFLIQQPQVFQIEWNKRTITPPTTGSHHHLQEL